MKVLVSFIVVIGLLAFGANYGYAWYNDQTTQPASDTSQKVAFKVTSGESTTEIADDLYAKGLIRSREVFELYVRLNGLAPSFQAGDYQLDKHESMRQITQDLQHARTDQVSFTIPEGYTIGRTAAKWEAEGHGPAQGYLDAANPANWQSYDFVAQRPQVAGRADSLEGYLTPETYFLNKGATAKDLVKAQLDQFQKVFTDQLRGTVKAHSQTIDQIVIMASMVDREVQSDPNRAIVCGVYYNRLDIHNALDVDATVLYALGRTSGAQNLTKEDLAAAADSPYDTYTHPGLPPGPISNPGAAALNACVNPQQRDQHYLFYFADCQGKTHFAKSEAEFESQLKQYGVVGNGC
ncbi:MAG: endolytic transglycosylase MltG [Chloroflexi bacterium]|nr:MAG: endolytic transglycosylase MltG [Chloroflexota bacterium]TMD54822.1 MAG: endolytic transglycosylase MltG [Chloroflexota bacterium]